MDINLTLFAQAVTFALFIGFTARFIWPYLAHAIEARQKTIAEGLAAAERGRQDLEQAAVQASQILRDARTQAQEILGQSEQRGSELIEESKLAAAEESARLVAGAREEIAQELARAKEALRRQVAALAVTGAEQILRREIDERSHAALLAGLQRQL